MSDDAQLLRRYAETGAEEAFTELVRRHLDLTWAAAYRITGDAHLARDVAQTVFADLARKARHLRPDTVLPGWLYRAARFAAAKVNRGNHRRSQRERQAMHLAQLQTEPEPSTAEAEALLPQLDAALAALSPIDRDAVVLRYFSRQSLAAVGNALGVNEDAARKRIARAVDKLRAWFERRGLVTATGALVAALGVAGTQAAPVGLAGTLAAASLAGAGTFGVLETLILMKTKIALTVAAVAAVATPLTYQQIAVNRLRAENRALQGQVQQVRAAQPTDADLAKHKADAAELERLRAEHLDLLRLRGEVGPLRAEAARAKELAQKLAQLSAQLRASAAARPAASPDSAEKEQAKQIGIAKLNLLKQWGLAMIMYADDNGDQLPTTFAAARNYLGKAGDATPILTEDQLEITYQGKLSDIANPAQTILMREKEPVIANGKLCRGYLFADGHSEIHTAPDGNFAPWELERGVPSQLAR